MAEILPVSSPLNVAQLDPTTLFGEQASQTPFLGFVSAGGFDNLFPVVVVYSGATGAQANSPYTPAPNTTLLVDTTLGPVTINLPSTNAVGALFHVSDYQNICSMNNILINPPARFQMEDPNNPGVFQALGVGCVFNINGMFAMWQSDGVSKLKVISVGS
jgi:hypothetical protein